MMLATLEQLPNGHFNCTSGRPFLVIEVHLLFPEKTNAVFGGLIWGWGPLSCISGKSKCSFWRCICLVMSERARLIWGLGPLYCISGRYFLGFEVHLLFTEKANAVSGGLIWGWGPISCISGWHLLGIGVHLLFPEKANAPLKSLFYYFYAHDNTCGGCQ